LKQTFSLIRRDADARVGDGKAQLHAFIRLTRVGDPHDDLAVLGELEGVAHEVEQHLLQRPESPMT